LHWLRGENTLGSLLGLLLLPLGFLYAPALLLPPLRLSPLARFRLLAFTPLPFLLRQMILLFQTLLGCQLLELKACSY
jgi:hypothetical protein